MFDSGFLEMIVVAVIALLVVGPERLPGIARKVGTFVGKARAFVNTTKADIEKELQAEEMKSMLSRQEQEISELRNMMQDAQQTIHKEVEELDGSVSAAMQIQGDSIVEDASIAEGSSTTEGSIDDVANTSEDAALLTDSNDNKKT
ncbi:MAG: Sec-independent protein translocase protein TatB [Thiotrichaceae bacterium]